MPADQSLKPLWKTVSKHVGFDPAVIEDEDIKKIFSGMNSVVDGIGSLRTHGSTAHGRGRKPYRIRLAMHDWRFTPRIRLLAFFWKPGTNEKGRLYHDE